MALRRLQVLLEPRTLPVANGASACSCIRGGVYVYYTCMGYAISYSVPPGTAIRVYKYLLAPSAIAAAEALRRLEMFLEPGTLPVADGASTCSCIREGLYQEDLVWGIQLVKAPRPVQITLYRTTC